jgi:Tfp pilus assembly protein FimT
MAVITMVGIIAVAASPSVIRFQRDSRVLDAGAEIANLYRFARSRAMARGAAVSVRYYKTPDALATLSGDPDPRARFVVKEAVEGTAAADADHQRLGTANCIGTVWDKDSTLNSRFVAMFDERSGRYDPALAEFESPNGTFPDQVDMCFTPRGRVWMSINGGAYQVLNSVPRIRLTNVSSDAAPDSIRFIIVPPSGAAKLIAEVQ